LLFRLLPHEFLHIAQHPRVFLVAGTLYPALYPQESVQIHPVPIGMSHLPNLALSPGGCKSRALHIAQNVYPVWLDSNLKNLAGPAGVEGIWASEFRKRYVCPGNVLPG
jgi:hypothetical protein